MIIYLSTFELEQVSLGTSLQVCLGSRLGASLVTGRHVVKASMPHSSTGRSTSTSRGSS